jgi:tetratricopeptide (TPR) repeat protein
MAFFRRIRAGALYGKAAAKFLRGDFAEAAVLFERSRSLLPNDERIEFTLSYLGRSYAALGRTSDALRVLESAYEPFRKRGTALKETNEQREFLEFLKTFSVVLRRSGQSARADEVEREAMEHARAFQARA